MNRQRDWATGRLGDGAIRRKETERWTFPYHPVTQSPSRPVSLAHILFFDGDQFGDAFAMTRGAFGSRKPDADDFAHLFSRNHAGAERQDIGVVVLPAVAGRRRVVTHGGADAGHFVRGHAGPDSGAVDHDAEVACAIGHRPRDGVGEIGVIYGFFGESSEVAMAVAEFVEIFLEALFHFIPAMIGADRDKATLAGNGAASAIADFDAQLPYQILRCGGDDRVFTNDEHGAGPDVCMDVAQIGLGDHVFRRLVYYRRPRIGARRLAADPLSQGIANHRADLLSIQRPIRRVHLRTLHALP